MPDAVPSPDPSPEPAIAAGDADALPASIQAHELAADPRRLAAVLVTVLDQQSRDAAANRAQARELIRAIDGVAKSHEFLGMELRDERRRSRALLAALVFVPLAVIVGGVFLALSASGTDDRVAALERDVAAVRDRNDEARIEGLRRDFEDRLRAAGTDAEAARTELGSAREALDAERRAREAREARARDLETRLSAMEKEQAELTGLRMEAQSLRQLAGAEKARADAMARALADAARAGVGATASPGTTVPAGGGSAAGTPSPAGTSPGPSSAAPASPAGTPVPSASREPALPGPVALPAPVTQVPAPSPPAGTADRRTATRDAGDLERIRSKINSLLEGTTGATRYEFEGIGGVSGTDLLDVRVVGRDAAGTVFRTAEARRAEITVEASGKVRIRLADGHLLLSGRKAPFFDGAYSIPLDTPPGPWRQSGLSCIRLQ